MTLLPVTDASEGQFCFVFLMLHNQTKIEQAVCTINLKIINTGSVQIYRNEETKKNQPL